MRNGYLVNGLTGMCLANYWLLVIGAGIGIYLLLRTFEKDSGDVIQRSEDIASNYSTKMRPTAAKHEMNKSQHRSMAAMTLNGEVNAVSELNNSKQAAQKSAYDLTHTLERLDRDEELKRAQHNLEVQLIGEASQKKLDVASYTEVQRKYELDRLELDKNWQQAEQALKAGFIYQLQAQQHLALITEYIGGLYNRAEKLKAEGKQRELDLVEEHIEFMEQDFRGRQRLLQAADGEAIQGRDPDTES